MTDTQENQTMQERCAAHALIAARHAKMKSLDSGKTALEFMAQGLMLIFSIEYELAKFLAIVCSGHAADLLIARRLEQARQDGASETEMAFLQNAAAEAKSRGPAQDFTPTITER
jgi:hypothetical protein